MHASFSRGAHAACFLLLRNNRRVVATAKRGGDLSSSQWWDRNVQRGAERAQDFCFIRLNDTIRRDRMRGGIDNAPLYPRRGFC